MEILGSTLEFDLPKGKIIFHQDLKKYLDIRTQLWQEREDEKGILRKLFEPQAIIDAISLKCIDYIQSNLIVSLAQYGLYDLTVEDFLLDNPGYKALILAAEKHHSYVMALSDAANKVAEKNRAKAAAAASQQITGMGFGVISNDPIAHALYAAKSQSVLERQTTRAQMAYNSAVSAIDTSTRNAVATGAADHRNTIFEPEIVASIDQIFEYILTKYCSYMSLAGQFDMDCLSEIDETRSNAVLNNLDVVPDKESVITKAIQLCPFNLAAYEALDQAGLNFLPTHRDILSYLELTDVFCNQLIQSYGIDPNNGVLSNYELVAPLIKSIALLKNTDETFAAHIVLGAQFFADLSVYTSFGEAIKSQKSVRSALPKYSSVDPKDFSKLLVETLPTYHLSPEAVTLYKHIGWDTFSFLSDAFEADIQSFEDADKQVINAWNQEKNKVIIESLDKEITEKKIEVKMKNRDLKEVNKEFTAGLVSTIVCVPMLVLSMLMWHDGFTMKFLVITFWILTIVVSVMAKKEFQKKGELQRSIEELNAAIAELEREKAQYL